VALVQGCLWWGPVGRVLESLAWHEPHVMVALFVMQVQTR
jgi:hypothetical protein